MKNLILSMVLIAACIGCFAQNSPQPSREDKPPTIEELRVGPMKGLGDRAGLIRYISSADSDFVFKRRDDVDGKPDFYASDRYTTSVELIGNDDEVIMARWTFNFVSHNEAANIKELDRMRYFAMIMAEPDGAEWFVNFYKQFISNLTMPYSVTKELARMNRVGELVYNPGKRCITLTMTYKK